VLPSLVENLATNVHRRYPQSLFELGECIQANPKADTKASNVKKLAAVISHAGAGLSEIMSVFNALNEVLPVQLEVKEHDHPSFIPGRCASISLSGRQIGFLGELHPNVIQSVGLKMPTIGFEINAQEIWNALPKKG
jgi:phenylalanyl-tRNA synthetase beta chain